MSLQNWKDAAELIALVAVVGSLIDLDNEHFQYQAGFLDEEFFRNDTTHGIILFAPTWRRLGLQEARHEFREEVDRILAQQERR